MTVRDSASIDLKATLGRSAVFFAPVCTRPPKGAVRSPKDASPRSQFPQAQTQPIGVWKWTKVHLAGCVRYRRMRSRDSGVWTAFSRNQLSMNAAFMDQSGAG